MNMTGILFSPDELHDFELQLQLREQTEWYTALLRAIIVRVPVIMRVTAHRQRELQH
jgi:hypothetical protein